MLIRPKESNTADAGHDRADDLLGAVVPLRARDIPKTCEQSDLSNVVPFKPRARKGEPKDAPKDAPAVNCAKEERPAPHAASLDRRWVTALVAGSILIHGAVFALFNRQPEPHASIGVIAINAELILGADANAGQAETASESEIASAPSPETEKPDAQTPQAAAEPEVKPVEEPEEVKPEPPKPEEAVTEDVKPQEVTPEPPKPEETAEVKPDVLEQPIPVEEKPEPVRENAELVADAKPVENPSLTATAQEPVALPKPRPDIEPEKQVAKPAKPKAAKPEKEQAEKPRPERRAPSSVASTASNSVGRGRSSADSNYRGRVAAHLARYKRFPAEARRTGDHGTATITFSLSGSGSVTSVRLSRASGVPSIDREAQAMVRRASPFPAPPDGRRMSFTVPVSFHLR